MPYLYHPAVTANPCSLSQSLPRAVDRLPHLTKEGAMTANRVDPSLDANRDLHADNAQASNSHDPEMEAPLPPDAARLPSRGAKRPSAKPSDTVMNLHREQKTNLRRHVSSAKEERRSDASKRRGIEESHDGPQVDTFDNGTTKQTYPGGRVVVWFANADVKHVHPCGRVEYFYSDLSTWQVTHNTNVDTFYFDIGQVEAHKPNGDKDIIFPDGTVRIVLADG